MAVWSYLRRDIPSLFMGGDYTRTWLAGSGLWSHVRNAFHTEAYITNILQFPCSQSSNPSPPLTDLGIDLIFSGPRKLILSFWHTGRKWKGTIISHLYSLLVEEHPQNPLGLSLHLLLSPSSEKLERRCWLRPVPSLSSTTACLQEKHVLVHLLGHLIRALPEVLGKCMQLRRVLTNPLSHLSHVL